MNEIKVTTNLTKADYRNIFYYSVYVKRPVNTVIIIVSLLLAIACIILKFPVILSVIFFAYPILIIAFNEYSLSKMIKKKTSGATVNNILTLNDEGLTVKSGDEEEKKYGYNKFLSVRETKNYFLFYMKDKSTKTLPKSCIQKSDFSKIRNLLINKLSYKNYKLKG